MHPAILLLLLKDELLVHQGLLVLKLQQVLVRRCSHEATIV